MDFSIEPGHSYHLAKVCKVVEPANKVGPWACQNTLCTITEPPTIHTNISISAENSTQLQRCQLYDSNSTNHVWLQNVKFNISS
jgi:hypothetical protein